MSFDIQDQLGWGIRLGAGVVAKRSQVGFKALNEFPMPGVKRALSASQKRNLSEGKKNKYSKVDL